MLRLLVCIIGLFVAITFNPPAFASDVSNGLAPPIIPSGVYTEDQQSQILLDNQAGINFAGNYTISQWGCGMWCESGVIADRITGKLTQLPTASGGGYEFRPEKGVLIVNPDLSALTDSSGKIHPLIFREFYKIKDGVFIFVRKDKTGKGTPTSEQVFAAYPTLPVLGAWVDPCIQANLCD